MKNVKGVESLEGATHLTFSIYGNLNSEKLHKIKYAHKRLLIDRQCYLVI